MADLEFLDTHIHFWDQREPKLSYSWLLPDAPDRSPLPRDFSAIRAPRYWPQDYIAETRFANVGKVIHVQVALDIADPVEETRWLQRLADDTGLPHGIVAYADLGHPDVERVIQGHLESPNTRGIRDLRYDGYLTDDAWVRGYSLLERYGLVLCDDPLLEVMPDAVALARRFPGITYCVDHAGWPRRRDKEYFREWAVHMGRLAAVPNTIVKISGLGMSEHRWTPASLRPWIRTCIELWGTDRVCFGSNWPVDRLFSSFGDVVDAYREAIDDFTLDEKVAMFSGNAERIFRL